MLSDLYGNDDVGTYRRQLCGWEADLGASLSGTGDSLREVPGMQHKADELAHLTDWNPHRFDDISDQVSEQRDHVSYTSMYYDHTRTSYLKNYSWVSDYPKNDDVITTSTRNDDSLSNCARDDLFVRDDMFVSNNNDDVTRSHSHTIPDVTHVGSAPSYIDSILDPNRLYYPDSWEWPNQNQENHNWEDSNGICHTRHQDLEEDLDCELNDGVGLQKTKLTYPSNESCYWNDASFSHVNPKIWTAKSLDEHPYRDPEFWIPRRPLASDRVYHFNVLYNHAKSALSRTDDTGLAMRVTTALVERLELMGYVNSYYHDRDHRPQNGLTRELERVMAGSSMTILLLTPGFLVDCLQLYLDIPVFRQLLSRRSPNRRLLVLSIGVSKREVPAELHPDDVLYFKHDWELDIPTWSRFDDAVLDTLPALKLSRKHQDGIISQSKTTTAASYQFRCDGKNENTSIDSLLQTPCSQMRSDMSRCETEIYKKSLILGVSRETTNETNVPVLTSDGLCYCGQCYKKETDTFRADNPRSSWSMVEGDNTSKSLESKGAEYQLNIDEETDLNGPHSCPECVMYLTPRAMPQRGDVVSVDHSVTESPKLNKVNVSGDEDNKSLGERGYSDDNFVEDSTFDILLSPPPCDSQYTFDHWSKVTTQKEDTCIKEALPISVGDGKVQTSDMESLYSGMSYSFPKSAAEIKAPRKSFNLQVCLDMYDKWARIEDDVSTYDQRWMSREENDDDDDEFEHQWGSDKLHGEGASKSKMHAQWAKHDTHDEWALTDSTDLRLSSDKWTVEGLPEDVSFKYDRMTLDDTDFKWTSEEVIENWTINTSLKSSLPVDFNIQRSTGTTINLTSEERWFSQEDVLETTDNTLWISDPDAGIDRWMKTTPQTGQDQWHDADNLESWASCNQHKWTMSDEDRANVEWALKNKERMTWTSTSDNWKEWPPDDPSDRQIPVNGSDLFSLDHGDDTQQPSDLLYLEKFYDSRDSYTFKHEYDNNIESMCRPISELASDHEGQKQMSSVSDKSPSIEDFNDTSCSWTSDARDDDRSRSSVVTIRSTSYEPPGESQDQSVYAASHKNYALFQHTSVEDLNMRSDTSDRSADDHDESTLSLLAGFDENTSFSMSEDLPTVPPDTQDSLEEQYPLPVLNKDVVHNEDWLINTEVTTEHPGAGNTVQVTLNQSTCTHEGSHRTASPEGDDNSHSDTADLQIAEEIRHSLTQTDVLEIPYDSYNNAHVETQQKETFDADTNSKEISLASTVVVTATSQVSHVEAKDVRTAQTDEMVGTYDHGGEITSNALSDSTHVNEYDEDQRDDVSNRFHLINSQEGLGDNPEHGDQTLTHGLVNDMLTGAPANEAVSVSEKKLKDGEVIFREKKDTGQDENVMATDVEKSFQENATIIASQQTTVVEQNTQAQPDLENQTYEQSQSANVQCPSEDELDGTEKAQHPTPAQIVETDMPARCDSDENKLLIPSGYCPTSVDEVDSIDGNAVEWQRPTEHNGLQSAHSKKLLFTEKHKTEEMKSLKDDLGVLNMISDKLAQTEFEEQVDENIVARNVALTMQVNVQGTDTGSDLGASFIEVRHGAHSLEIPENFHASKSSGGDLEEKVCDQDSSQETVICPQQTADGSEPSSVKWEGEQQLVTNLNSTETIPIAEADASQTDGLIKSEASENEKMAVKGLENSAEDSTDISEINEGSVTDTFDVTRTLEIPVSICHDGAEDATCLHSSKETHSDIKLQEADHSQDSSESGDENKMSGSESKLIVVEKYVNENVVAMNTTENTAVDSGGTQTDINKIKYVHDTPNITDTTDGAADSRCLDSTQETIRVIKLQAGQENVSSKIHAKEDNSEFKHMERTTASVISKIDSGESAEESLVISKFAKDWSSYSDEVRSENDDVRPMSVTEVSDTGQNLEILDSRTKSDEAEKLDFSLRTTNVSIFHQDGQGSIMQDITAEEDRPLKSGVAAPKTDSSVTYFSRLNIPDEHFDENLVALNLAQRWSDLFDSEEVQAVSRSENICSEQDLVGSRDTDKTDICPQENIRDNENHFCEHNSSYTVHDFIAQGTNRIHLDNYSVPSLLAASMTKDDAAIRGLYDEIMGTRRSSAGLGISRESNSSYTVDDFITNGTNWIQLDNYSVPSLLAESMTNNDSAVRSLYNTIMGRGNSSARCSIDELSSREDPFQEATDAPSDDKDGKMETETPFNTAVDEQPHERTATMEIDIEALTENENILELPLLATGTSVPGVDSNLSEIDFQHDSNNANISSQNEKPDFMFTSSPVRSDLNSSHTTMEEDDDHKFFTDTQEGAQHRTDYASVPEDSGAGFLSPRSLVYSEGDSGYFGEKLESLTHMQEIPEHIDHQDSSSPTSVQSQEDLNLRITGTYEESDLSFANPCQRESDDTQNTSVHTAQIITEQYNVGDMEGNQQTGLEANLRETISIGSTETAHFQARSSNMQVEIPIVDNGESSQHRSDNVPVLETLSRELRGQGHEFILIADFLKARECSRSSYETHSSHFRFNEEDVASNEDLKCKDSSSSLAEGSSVDYHDVGTYFEEEFQQGLREKEYTARDEGSFVLEALSSSAAEGDAQQVSGQPEDTNKEEDNLQTESLLSLPLREISTANEETAGSKADWTKSSLQGPDRGDTTKSAAEKVDSLQESTGMTDITFVPAKDEATEQMTPTGVGLSDPVANDVEPVVVKTSWQETKMMQTSEAETTLADVKGAEFSSASPKTTEEVNDVKEAESVPTAAAGASSAAAAGAESVEATPTEEKANWMLEFYKGVCHVLSKPDMPYLG